MLDLKVKTITALDLSDPETGSGISTQMKTHCRTDEDIGLYIMAAIAFVEAESGRSIRAKNIRMTTVLEAITSVPLYRGPVTKVNSVKYYLDGVQTVLPEEDYRLIQAGGDQLAPAYGTVWPCPGTEVEIDYEVGLGLLSEKAFQAVAMLTGHFYKNRESVEVGNKTPVEVPMAARDLINLMMGE